MPTAAKSKLKTTAPASTPEPEYKAVASTLPRTLAQVLPTAVDMMAHVAAIEKLVPALAREMGAAEKRGALDLARAFVVLHRLREALLSDKLNRFKPIGALFTDYSSVRIPAAFEQSGITHAPLAEGFRVQVSYAFRASIKGDQKDAAYQWLRSHGLGDIITSTVNASTLSATAKALRDDKNLELPEQLFTAADVPGTSVTKT